MYLTTLTKYTRKKLEKLCSYVARICNVTFEYGKGKIDFKLRCSTAGMMYYGDCFILAVFYATSNYNLKNT